MTGFGARLATLLATSALLSPGAARGGVSGRWQGQDGHDLVGLGSARQGNGFQDIRVALAGLPPGRGIAFAKLEGLGGDEWQFGGPPSSWLAAIERRPGAAVADLFFEPCRRETGRPFHLALRFDDGSRDDCWIKGGDADPDRRTPAAALRATWAGQGADDRVGPTPAVGPDGFRDVRLILENLSTTVEARSVAVAGPDGVTWQTGLNPEGLGGAELARRPDAPGAADLFFGLDRDRAGQTLRVTVAYADGKADRARLVAGAADPRARVLEVAPPTFAPNAVAVRWDGQEGGEGEVRLSLSGLDPARPVVGAALSDAVQGTWAWRRDDQSPFQPEPYSRTLDLRQEGGTASLSFAATRDETGASMTLRLVLGDGSTAIARFPGGACDPGRRGPPPEATRIEAAPGADLNELAGRFGTIRLRAGDYRLARPLVLARPVAIVGVPGSRLVFEQGANDPPWSAAIKLHAGRTTLEGFAVRFAGPIRWAPGVDHGPAVIGSTDNLDTGRFPGPRAGIALLGLDLESPPAANPSAPQPGEEAPRLIRLATMENGRVERNRLSGGPIELIGGPWVVAGNAFLGTPAGTHSFTMIGAHRSHDLRVVNNRARVEPPSGKVYRFLVLTQAGAENLVEGNVVSGVGPKDGDSGPNMNAPELVLTESYRLHFEGRPLSTSADGRVVVIPGPQGEPARAGSVVAALTGARAGRWARITQAIDARTYLLDEPLSAEDAVVSIATGFVGQVYRGNTVDARGGPVAAPFVLGGNHFGTQFLDNHIFGGGEGFRIVATPTEAPGPWGWSRNPMLGLLIGRNVIEDSGRGANLAVEHGPQMKSTRGRMYLTATVAENTFRWSAPALARLKPGSAHGLTIGEPGSLDGREALVSERETRVEVPRGEQAPEALRVLSGWVNGKVLLDGKPVAGP